MPVGAPGAYSARDLKAWQWEATNNTPVWQQASPEQRNALAEAWEQRSGAGGARPETAGATVDGLAPDPPAPTRPRPQGDTSRIGPAPSPLKRLPSSAWQLVKDVTAPIHSPIDTGKGLYKLASGLVQMAIPGEQGNEEVIRAVGEHMANRYGSFEKTKEAFQYDPAGVVADVGSLVAGGGALAGSKAAAKAASLAGGAARKVGGGAANVTGFTSGLKAGGVKEAARAGLKSVEDAGVTGRATEQPFVRAARGQTPQDAAVTQARAAVDAIRKQRSDAYAAGKARVYGEVGKATPLPFDEVINKALADAPTGKFKGVEKNPETARLRGEIGEIIDEWRELDPAEYHTVEGLDAMRQRVGSLYDTLDYDSPSRKVVDSVYGGLRQAISDLDPEYGKILTAYDEQTKLIREIERSLSLGKNAAADTSLRKLQSILRDDVSSAYGQRGRYAEMLKEAGADDLGQLIAGQAAQSWTPRGVSWIPGAVTVGGASVGGMGPGALATLPAMSPRAVGMGAYRVGQGAGRAEALARALAGAGQSVAQPQYLAPAAAFQAGRARENR